jgi:osmotically-inducible protein OsmY
MGKYCLLFPLLFGLTIIVMGCDERDRQASTRTSTPPAASKINDYELEKAVRAKLETDAQLKEANLSVNAIAERHEITLSGTVSSHAARKRAIELAKSAKAGILVNNIIDVKPAVDHRYVDSF